MQLPPFSFTDLSLLCAMSAITLLVILEIASPYLGLTNFVINKKKLRISALILSILFLITFAIRTYIIVIGS